MISEELRNGLTDLKQEIEDSVTERLKKVKIRIFVFGPSLNSKTVGSKLREYIIAKCRRYYTVVPAEHKEIINIYKRNIGPAHDLCNMEYDLAKHIVDGIIILPDSSGSLIELGMFSLHDELHRKMLILFNDKYQAEMLNNFVGQGAKSAYDNGNAQTVIVNYRHRRIAWDEISGFLDFLKGKKYWQEVKKKP